MKWPAEKAICRSTWDDSGYGQEALRVGPPRWGTRDRPSRSVHVRVAHAGSGVTRPNRRAGPMSLNTAEEQEIIDRFHLLWYEEHQRST